MTIESFYETLKFAVWVDVRLRLQTSLEAIRDTLNNLVASPAHPQQQSSLASALKTFALASEELGKSLTPSQKSAIADARGAEFFDSSLADKVKSVVATNAMTPSVARDFVQDLADRRAAYLTTIEQTLSGLDTFGVSIPEIPPGAANMAFVVPREMFDNELASFAKELTFISHLIEHFSEAVTGAPQPVFLDGSSSSGPTVVVAASPTVTETIATIVGRFLETWEKAEKVRRIRQELIEVGLKKQTFDELSDQIRASVNEVIEESIQIALNGYNSDPTRKQQLEIALQQDTRRLFGQIERGLAIQFHAKADANADEADQIALKSIDRISRQMTYPRMATEPMLLTRAQLFEGDFDSASLPKIPVVPPPHRPNGAQPAPLATPVALSGSNAGSLWGRRRTDK